MIRTKLSILLILLIPGLGVLPIAATAEAVDNTHAPDLSDDRDSHELRMKSLRALGDFGGALRAAYAWRDAVEANDESAPWLIQDARNATRTLEHWIVLPDSLREAAITADTLTPKILGALRTRQYDQALIMLDEQLVLRRSVLPADHLDVAENLRRHGVVHLQQGRYAMAAATTHEALDMLHRICPDDHPVIAHTLHNLATVYRLMGDFAAAEPLYHDALDMRRRVHEPGAREIVSSIHNLAIFLSVKGDHAGAEVLFREVLHNQKAQLGEESANVALTLHNLGNSILEAGRPHDALPVLREALVATRRLHAEPSVYEAGNLHSLGVAHHDLKLFVAADSLLLEAETLYRRTLSDDHPHVADVLTDRGLCRRAVGDFAGAETLLRRACEVYDLARLNVGAGYERSDFQESPYADLAATLLAQGDGNGAWEAAEHTLARTLEDLLSPNDEPASAPLSLADLQAGLTPGTALLGWLTTDHRLRSQAWIYFVPDRGDVRWYPIPETRLTHARNTAREYRETLSRAGSWPFRVRETDRLDAMSRSLFADWVAPVTPDLENLERLVVLPAGDMQGIPVESLRDVDGGMMDDDLIVCYAPSAAIFVRLQHASHRAMPADRALLIGDPPLESTLLPALPGARDEVQHLAAVFPDASILLGAEASEPALSRLNETGELERFRWIHLATHATVDPVNPDRSALVLAGDEKDEDGRLTAGEIIRSWSLSADLVTLSGCRTALGRPSRGEGYVGLAHAFLRAGARNLVISLWPVEDEATREFMTRFYAGLLDRDLSPAAALRLARTQLRNYRTPDGDQPYRHPAYWSGFVLMGGN